MATGSLNLTGAANSNGHVETFGSLTGGRETVILPDKMIPMRVEGGSTEFRQKPMGSVAIEPGGTKVRGKARIEAIKQQPMYGVRFESLDDVAEQAEQAELKEAPSEQKIDRAAKEAPAEENSGDLLEGSIDAELPASDGATGHAAIDQAIEEAEGEDESEYDDKAFSNLNAALSYLGREKGATSEQLEGLAGDPEAVRSFAQEEYGIDFPKLAS